MLSTHLKKSIAVSAVLASSIAAAVGFTAAAQAAPAGPANSPLTLDRGAWSPDGSRYVFTDAAGAILTAQHGEGGAPFVVDPAKPGVSRSHPTWFAGGTAIVFSETANGTSKLMSVPAYTDPQVAVQETNPLSYLNGITLGTETAPDSNGGTLAFQHHNNAAAEDEIWVQDAFGRGSGGPMRATDNGMSPSVSPDGKTIAFLRTDADGNKQLWTVPWNGQNATPHAGTPVQLTHDAHDHTNPTWTPDGSRITFEQGPGPGAAPTSVQSVAKDGGGQRQEADHAGVPSYQPLVEDTVTRLAGNDRIGTAVATSQAKWPTAPYVKKGSDDATRPAGGVVLARYDLPYDALGGSALASSKAAPLLLTPGDHLDAGVKAEITRVLGPAPGSVNGGWKPTVYVLGGEQALSPAVFNAVKAMGYDVKRVSGPDRYSTSVAIAKEVTGSYNGPTQILAATGDDFPDALSAGAASQSGPRPGSVTGVVVLTHDKVLPPSVAAYISSAAKTANVYAVGGQADAALAHVNHHSLVGADRYQTSYLVARTFFGDWQGYTAPESVGFATGKTWPDALAGGAFMSEVGGPLLLVDPATGLPSTQAQGWLAGWAPALKDGYVFGGTAALGADVPAKIAGDIAGPAGVALKTNPKA
ncbi:cell wall-binding repeat-containing protein [Catenulispora subtropica]|uniref:WD40 domain protein beta Propeller n=1 Tax=Catenulispora subtropica TaxID=450798 RepID=A0ABN2QTV2_9ACTN